MTTLSTISQRLFAPFALDLRTLALFRICFGSVLIADLVIRAFTLTEHYTDLGILHRYDAEQALRDTAFSLHLLGGSAAFQAFLLFWLGCWRCFLLSATAPAW